MLLLLVACQWTPTVTPHDVGIRDLDLEGATVDLTLDVHNPIPASAQVDAHWNLLLDGVPVSNGTVTGLGIPASADSQLHLPVRLRWADLWEVAGTVGRPIPYAVDIDLAGRTGLGTWHTPFSHRGELPAMAWPELTVVDWRVDRFDLEQLAATLEVDVAQAPVHELDWAVHLGSVPFAHGRVARAEGPTELPVVVEIGRTLEALQSLPAAGLGLTMKGEVRTPLGALPVAMTRRWTM